MEPEQLGYPNSTLGGPVDIRTSDGVLHVDNASFRELRRYLTTTSQTSGTTHAFYRYPARFHPQVAREIIRRFSRLGDVVMDPFMGGGTTVIEALLLGRYAVGSDINALARFLTHVRTRPLSPGDKRDVRRWAGEATRRLSANDLTWVPRHHIVNLPKEVEIFLSGALQLAQGLPKRRQDFARAVLLRLGQMTVDCRLGDVPPCQELARRLPLILEKMITGLDNFVKECRRMGISTQVILGRRLLIHRNAIGMEADHRVRRLTHRPRLVLTSPPYPGVHVLYHRWQYLGRRETPAPYWLANVADGAGCSYYCGGSRTPSGLASYFSMIRRAFTSIRKVIHPSGYVVQIVGFSNIDSQLPAYLAAIEEAGFQDAQPKELDGRPLQRRVANRKWYATLKGDTDASREFMLVHQVRN